MRHVIEAAAAAGAAIPFQDIYQEKTWFENIHAISMFIETLNNQDMEANQNIKSTETSIDR